MTDPAGGGWTGRVATGLLVLALAAACAPGPPPAPPGPPGSEGADFLAGYHPWWALTGEARYPLEALDHLFLFEVEAGPDGEWRDLHGWPTAWAEGGEGVAARARRAGVPIALTVTAHEPGAFETIFKDPARTDRLMERVLEAVTALPGTGVHLDLEVFDPVAPAARDGYTAFVAEVARRLRARDPGAGLTVFVPAFDDADAYNERALAAVADYLVVQGYDLHHQTDERAGPVAALRGWGRLNWGEVVERYRALGVPSGRIVMAAPLYGYEWPTESDEPGAATRGPGVPVPLDAPEGVLTGAPRARAQAERHGARRDPESGSPWYAYRDAEGGWIQGWYDDARSLAEKLAFVREAGLGGLALFPLSYGTDAVWAELRPRH
ncbi:MAG: glycosyl hydrolase family 18 protein [Longimicrobiales bacterium]|nr:glycosyl hydrolase family 18 protein [Longimicrobiales bacterium]